MEHIGSSELEVALNLSRLEKTDRHEEAESTTEQKREEVSSARECCRSKGCDALQELYGGCGSSIVCGATTPSAARPRRRSRRRVPADALEEVSCTKKRCCTFMEHTGLALQDQDVGAEGEHLHMLSKKSLVRGNDVVHL